MLPDEVVETLQHTGFIVDFDAKAGLNESGAVYVTLGNRVPSITEVMVALDAQPSDFGRVYRDSGSWVVVEF